ncbi:MAG: type I-E CRISPR-associated protein Cas5/CasD [Caldilineaceae bacterium]
MANTLFLRLEGLMQSWGERGRWSVRDSASEPTKSGVVGLLACALGINRDHELEELSRSLQFSVRCDREGAAREDYHTVGGGYRAPQLLQADGKSKGKIGSAHTELTYRTYLYDASFLVAIQSDDRQINRLAHAIQNPQWVLFLGRKSCPPSRPIYEGMNRYDSCQAALEDWPWYCPEATTETTIDVRAVLESSRLEGGVQRRHELISRNRRVYGPVYMRDIRLKINIIPDFPVQLG